MKITQNENWYLLIMIGAAVLAMLVWSAPTQAEENASGSQYASNQEYRLASAADMSGMPPGKHSPLPATSPNDKKFFAGDRDPFKPPKSDQLCSADVAEACKKPDQEREPLKSGG